MEETVAARGKNFCTFFNPTSHFPCYPSHAASELGHIYITAACKPVCDIIVNTLNIWCWCKPGVDCRAVSQQVKSFEKV